MSPQEAHNSAEQLWWQIAEDFERQTDSLVNRWAHALKDGSLSEEDSWALTDQNSEYARLYSIFTDRYLQYQDEAGASDEVKEAKALTQHLKYAEERNSRLNKKITARSLGQRAVGWLTGRQAADPTQTIPYSELEIADAWDSNYGTLEDMGLSAHERLVRTAALTVHDELSAYLDTIHMINHEVSTVDATTPSQS